MSVQLLSDMLIFVLFLVSIFFNEADQQHNRGNMYLFVKTNLKIQHLKTLVTVQLLV